MTRSLVRRNFTVPSFVGDRGPQPDRASMALFPAWRVCGQSARFPGRPDQATLAVRSCPVTIAGRCWDLGSAARAHNFLAPSSVKILFSHYLLDDDNPPVRTNTAIASQLRELGHEVHLHRSTGPPIAVTQGREGSRSHRPGVLQRLKNQIWFTRASLRNLGTYRRDKAVLREYGPDVVLVRHDAYWCSMAWAAERAGVPLVTYVNAPMAYETRLYNAQFRWHPPGVVEWFERQALPRSQALTATSHPTMHKIREDYGITAPILVVPNGLHPERFPEFDEATRQERRRTLGVDAPVVLGFQGTFMPFHGIDRLQQLMLSLAHRKNTHWLLIGDGPERPALQEAVTGRVPATFMGRQPPDTVGALLGLIDVAVVPHQFVQGIFYLSPLKVIESAAAGCAVVASRQGDIPWLLDDGRAGVLVGSPDLADWSRAIESLIDDPRHRRELGQAARRVRPRAIHLAAHRNTVCRRTGTGRRVRSRCAGSLKSRRRSHSDDHLADPVSRQLRRRRHRLAGVLPPRIWGRPEYDDRSAHVCDDPSKVRTNDPRGLFAHRDGQRAGRAPT